MESLALISLLVKLASSPENFSKQLFARYLKTGTKLYKF